MYLMYYKTETAVRSMGLPSISYDMLMKKFNNETIRKHVTSVLNVMHSLTSYVKYALSECAKIDFVYL